MQHTHQETGNAHLVQVHRVTPFVIVLMTSQHQVNAILVQQWLNCCNHLIPQIASSRAARQ